MPVLSVSTSYPRQPLVDWDLITEPQTSANNRRIHFARGKTLGGCSAINTLGYHRGSIGSYQYWADLVGDQSYTWPNILPYFKKSTTLTPPDLAKRNVQNATVLYEPKAFDNSLNGPVQVSWGNWVDITGTWLALGMQSIGLPLSPTGFSSGILSGYGGWVTSEIKAKDATRSSSEASYLRQAIEDTDIMVYTHTQAQRILFDQGTPQKANSVLVSTNGYEYIISANKEVILSAGVFHSPQLLMVSGIGPKATLEANDIPVVVDLPGVGQNLQDQIFFDVLSGVNTPNTAALVADPTQTANLLSNYFNNATGPYSSAGGFIAFEKIPPSMRNFTKRTSDLLNTIPADWPELEYIVLAYPNTPGANATTVGAMSGTIQAPFSRGNVTISSSSMLDPPLINMGWLTDPADGELLVAAVKRCRQAWASDVLKPIKVGPEILPGPDVQSDADILVWLRGVVAPVWHPSSTCSMGKKGL
ncbi:FAD-linked reductase [Mollisia scopiformis]|uniref:FAD-linked reductase n=1 Tax=Mollisia scopiformis TaxID=149040 RepID=A0A194WZ29_MOLSC|nr:FAD-linked reductase [Mollisia scopiformis]KUJ12847.1 FAD-linked reductase [Mollisia scopiformis]